MMAITRHSVGHLIRNLPEVGSVVIEILNQVQDDGFRHSVGHLNGIPEVGSVAIEILNQVPG